MRCSSRLAQENQDRAARWRGWSRLRLVLVGSHVRRAGAIAHADAHPRRHPPGFTRPCPAPTPSTVINSTVSSGAARDQSRQQFPGAAGQPVEQRLQPPAADQSRAAAAPPRARKRRVTGPGSKATGSHAQNGAIGDFVGDSRKTWGGVAGIGARVAPGINIGFSVDQSRSGDRRSAGAAIGDDRPDPARLHRLRRQRAVDLGERGGARFRQHQFAPRHRLWACDRRLQCAARRRAERDQLLLDQGPEPHRAQGRVRICPRPDRFAAGDRRPRSR